MQEDQVAPVLLDQHAPGKAMSSSAVGPAPSCCERRRSARTDGRERATAPAQAYARVMASRGDILGDRTVAALSGSTGG